MCTSRYFIKITGNSQNNPKKKIERMKSGMY